MLKIGVIAKFQPCSGQAFLVGRPILLYVSYLAEDLFQLVIDGCILRSITDWGYELPGTKYVI